MLSIVSRFLFFMLLSLPIAAATNLVLDNAQRQLQILDPVLQSDKALRDLYLSIVDGYSQITATQSQIDQFKSSLTSLPKEISQLKILLSKTGQKKSTLNLKASSLVALELRVTQLKSTQLQLQQNRSELENEINQYHTQPTDLRNRLTFVSQSSAKVDHTLPSKIQQQLDDALFSLNNLQIQAINLELLLIPLQSEHSRLKLNQIDAELLALNLTIRRHQDRVQTLRKSETDKLLEEIVATDNRANNPQATADLIVKNNQLSEDLRLVIASSASTVDRLRIIEQQHKLISQSFQVIKQQLEYSENSFGIELRNFSKRFASFNQLRDTQAEIARASLQDIELNQFKLDLAINAPDTTAWSEQERADFILVQTASLDLISNLHKAYAREIDSLAKTLILEQQVEQQFNKGQALLTEYLLWLPSVPPINTQWPQQLSMSLRTLSERADAFSNSIQFKPLEQWLRWIFIFLALSILSLLLLKYQYKHHKRWSRQIGNVVNDRFSRTLKMLILAPIICLPMPLFIYVLLNQSITISDLETLRINNILCASIWIYLSFTFWLKRPYGLFISHLDIPEEFCVKLKKLLLPLFLLATPLSWLLLYFDTIPSLALHASLGRLVFIALALVAAIFWAALWRVSHHIHSGASHISWWQQTKLWLTSLLIIHSLLVIGALLGYLYTAAMIITTILATTAVLFCTFIIYRLCIRWLLITERRLTFSKARLRRTEILAARENNQDIPPLEENYLGLKSVSEQATALLKALCFTLLSITIWLLVKNFLPSLDVLDNIILWSNDVTTASGVVSEQVSLRTIITSLFIIGLTILAAYNLPGLLELLVLRYLNLTPGTCYAITTITRYVLIIMCVMAAATQMGVEWAKLQWLVAAMGVGLGFGLQEIVANFVSGIIILFEKPVRIGDTVTIGGVTGKVTKIKIRATTISDWDRKEVIIPNKTFVTDQLINWSLSDAITRVTINVGVAYGSDTTLVQKTIQETVNNNPRVLREPEPEVFFTTFGDSTLNFELRFFVNNLADRNPAIHEINQLINAQFIKHNISIAFPQLDVHLHRR